jgi:hypothetical protein
MRILIPEANPLFDPFGIGKLLPKIDLPQRPKLAAINLKDSTELRPAKHAPPKIGDPGFKLLLATAPLHKEQHVEGVAGLLLVEDEFGSDEVVGEQGLGHAGGLGLAGGGQEGGGCQGGGCESDHNNSNAGAG